VAEGFEPGDEPVGFPGRVGAGGVEVGAEVGAGLAGGQHVPGDHGEGVGDGAFLRGGAPLAAEPAYQPVVPGPGAGR